MKRTILMIAGALAIASSAQAGSWGQDAADYLRAQSEAARNRAMTDTEHALQRQIEINTQIAINQEKREQQANAQASAQERADAQAIAKAKQEAAFKAGQESIAQRHGVTQVEPCDDAATIRLYLHDFGYNDVSDAQVAKIADYMHAHQIRHVSELAQ